jgi:nucleoside-diphosphate-sugar epimerase
MAEMTPYLRDVLLVCSENLPWEELSGCNVLITGATGLIGGCLVDVLMIHPHCSCHIYALGRNEERAQKRFAEYWNDDTFHFIQNDISVPLSCDIQFDYIIHAASNASPNFFKEKPVEVMKANLQGMVNLMEYGLSHNMKRMLYVSSGEIYGEGNGQAFKETDSGYVDCATARACYPSSKRATETLAISYAEEYGADVVIARPCHTYGPYFTESDNRVYAQFIRNVLRGEDIVMKSPGTQFRSWLYVVDCANAIFTILLKGGDGQAYNVADDNSNITIRELAETIAHIGQQHVIFNIDNLLGNTTPITKAVFSTEKLQNIGWRPLFKYDEGIKHSIETLSNKS